MGRTRMGRTDGLTDWQTDGRTRRRLYAPPKFFGEHKNGIILFYFHTVIYYIRYTCDKVIFNNCSSFKSTMLILGCVHIVHVCNVTAVLHASSRNFSVMDSSLSSLHVFTATGISEPSWNQRSNSGVIYLQK